MFTQALGFKFATPTTWRYVLLLSAVLGSVQLLISSAMVESPVWSKRNGKPQDAKTTLSKIWGNYETDRNQCLLQYIYIHTKALTAENRDAEDPLLADERPRAAEDRQETVSISQLFRSSELRRPVFIVSFAMICQQLSGLCLFLLHE